MNCGAAQNKRLTLTLTTLICCLATALVVTDEAAAQGDVKMQAIPFSDFSTFIASDTSETPRRGSAYDARSLWDGRTWTAWGSDDPQNTWVEVHFPVARYVAQIQIFTGDGTDPGTWKSSKRPRTLKMVHDHGEEEIVLEDSMATQTINFPDVIVTARIKIHFEGTYGKSRAPVTVSSMTLYEPEDVFDLKPNLRQEIIARVNGLRSSRTREEAVSRLEAIGTPARPWILTALKDPDAELRAAATTLLYRSKVTEGIEVVHAAAARTVNDKNSSQSPGEREFMRAALTFLGEQHAVRGARLAQKMYRDTSWRQAMEVEIVSALAQSGLPDSVGILTEAVASDKPALVEAALEAFAITGQAGIRGLNILAKKEKASVRIHAAQALGHFERNLPGPLVRTLLEDADPNVQAQMIRSLGEYPRDKWLAHIVKYQGDEDARIREAVARTMGRYVEQETAERLTEMTADAEPSVRTQAVRSLEAHGGSALDHLVVLALPSTNEHSDVTLNVQKVLTRLAQDHGEQLVGLLREPLDKARPADGQHLAYLLSACGSAGSTTLLEMVQGENTRLSFYAMRALERRPAGAVPAIEEDIRDRGFSEMSPSLAARYLRLLSTTGDPKHIPTITSALSDPRNYLRGEAMRALSSFKTDAAHRAMIRGLQDPWEDVRFEAASALGAHKVKAAVPALIQMVRKQDTKMLPAIRALGEIGDKGALKVLYESLDHDRSTVRQYTCTAIGDIGEPESLSHLLKAINDKDELVAFYAKRAMKRID